MTQEWGQWAREVPLPEPADAVTPTSHEIYPRLLRARHGLEAVPVRYRVRAGGAWEIAARVAGWARPTGTKQWTLAALTHLSACYPASDRRQMNSGHPRWRTAWVWYDPVLLEPVEPPTRYPSDYWRDSLAAALAEFARVRGDARRL